MKETTKKILDLVNEYTDSVIDIFSEKPEEGRSYSTHANSCKKKLILSIESLLSPHEEAGKEKITDNNQTYDYRSRAQKMLGQGVDDSGIVVDEAVETYLCLVEKILYDVDGRFFRIQADAGATYFEVRLLLEDVENMLKGKPSTHSEEPHP